MAKWWQVSWTQIYGRLITPLPAFCLFVVLGAGWYALSRYASLSIPVPAGYALDACEPRGASVCAGLNYCKVLAETAQRHSFAMEWGGWFITLVGGLTGLVVALRQEPSQLPASEHASQVPTPVKFSGKNWVVFWGAVAVATTTVGQRTVDRASNAAVAAAEATRVIGWLAAPEPSGMRATATEESARSVSATDADRMAYRRCTEVKAKWLDGRGDSALLEKLNGTLSSKPQ